MGEFFVSNLVGRKVEQDGNQILFLDNKKNQFLINILTRESELSKLTDFEYQYDSTLIDNDRHELLAKFKKTLDYIIDVNEKSNQIPTFALLQSETDFKQADIIKRVNKQVNKIGFNKQILGNEYHPRPFYDIRNLEQAELISIALALNTTGSNKAKSSFVKRKGIYLPEITYYNPNKQIVEIGKFRPAGNPKQYANTTHCHFCFEDEGVNHAKCKKEEDYLKYVIRREWNRYAQHLLITKERKEKIKGSRLHEAGIRLKPAELKREFIEKYSIRKLKQEKYFIGLIK